MTETEQAVVSNSFLFRGIPKIVIDEKLSLAGIHERTYQSGETLMASGEVNKKLIIMLYGDATVYKPITERKVPVNVLGAGDISGVSTLLCSSDMQTVTCVEACSPCKVLEIDEPALREMLHNDRILQNYISYLVRRIHFLARRMESFAENSTEDKLLNYLVSNAEDGTYHVRRSYAYMADTLSMGRASLYRAFDKLESRGLVKRNGKVITVLTVK